MTISIVPITPVTGSNNAGSQISVTAVNAPGFQKLTQTAAGLHGANASGDSTIITLGTNLAFSGSTLNASGGGSSDYLGTLSGAPVSVTSSVTATMSSLHVISGSSNITLTLPAASGNANKSIGIVILDTYTGILTVDGNASETINGALTRIMWAGESAHIAVNAGATAWYKVSGNTIPMTCVIKRTTDQSFTADAWRAVTFTAQDSGTALMWDSGNGRITIVRPGVVRASGVAYINGLGASTVGYTGIAKTAVDPAGVQTTAAPNGSSIQTQVAAQYTVVVGDYINLCAYASNAPVFAGATSTAWLMLHEVPTW